MSKYILFYYADKVIEKMPAENISLDSIEIIKNDVAYNHEIQVADIEVQIEDEVILPHAHYYINPYGKLMCDGAINNRECIGIRQAYKIDTEEEQNWFLDNFGGDEDFLFQFKLSGL